jgi:hypothetical protein
MVWTKQRGIRVPSKPNVLSDLPKRKSWVKRKHSSHLHIWWCDGTTVAVFCARHHGERSPVVRKWHLRGHRACNQVSVLVGRRCDLQHRELHRGNHIGVAAAVWKPWLDCQPIASHVGRLPPWSHPNWYTEDVVLRQHQGDSQRRLANSGGLEFQWTSDHAFRNHGGCRQFCPRVHMRCLWECGVQFGQLHRLRASGLSGRRGCSIPVLPANFWGSGFSPYSRWHSWWL